MAKYDIEILDENDESLHYRVTQGGVEVMAGGVSRAEYEAQKKRGKRGKAATLFAIAKSRMPELFGKGTVVSEVVEAAVDTVDTVGEPKSNTVDEVIHYVGQHGHEEYDAGLAELSRRLATLPTVDTSGLASVSHTHPPQEYELPPHGHQALDTRLKSLESTVETQGAHTHPAHTHPDTPHMHPEILRLNEALIALAEELRDTRLTFLGHDHKHRHEELEGKFADHLAWAAEHTHPHSHEGFLKELPKHSHPAVKHDHPADSSVAELAARVDEIVNRKRPTVDMRVLSRENRGGQDIIIAQEL